MFGDVSKLVVLLKSPFVLNFSNSSALERYYPTQALPTPPHPTHPIGEVGASVYI